MGVPERATHPRAPRHTIRSASMAAMGDLLAKLDGPLVR